jgi:hypothetical protein
MGLVRRALIDVWARAGCRPVSGLVSLDRLPSHSREANSGVDSGPH